MVFRPLCAARGAFPANATFVRPDVSQTLELWVGETERQVERDVIPLCHIHRSLHVTIIPAVAVAHAEEDSVNEDRESREWSPQEELSFCVGESWAV